jgi:regulator of replication initiation timing
LNKKVLDKDKLIEELFKRIEALTLRVKQLELENAELRARLNSNSRNSSRPPSSDGYRKKPAF